MRKERKHFTPEEKVAILRRHLVDKVPVSELCEELGLRPTVFYRWQKELFENGAGAFQSQERPHRQVEEKQKRIAVAMSDSREVDEFRFELGTLTLSSTLQQVLRACSIVYDCHTQMNFSHQVGGRTKIMSSPGFAVAVLRLQLL